jgi:V/A-type H+-transporting ATPase subunit A
MMKVIGEERTSIDDFIIYLKSEFLDYVFLQQNTFDPVDASTNADRQRYVFGKVCGVLESKFSFDDKEQARKWFLELRQLFLDWNYIAREDAAFEQQENAIDSKLAAAAEVK